MVSQSAHALFLAISCAFLVAACAWAYRKSPVLGAIVAVAAVLRLTIGVAAFAISYFHWPILQSLQAGEGFWAVFPDARFYYDVAASQAERHSLSITGGSPSPVYLTALSLWFLASGATVVSAVVFNVLCFVIAAIAMVSLIGELPTRAGQVVLFSFSFSPVLLLTSTQVLKDTFFAMLIVVGCVGTVLMLRYSRHLVAADRRYVVGGVAVAAFAIAAMAGVRAYYALFAWTAVAAALFTSWWTLPRGLRARFTAFAAAVLILLWFAFAVGADTYYVYYRDLIARTTGVNLSLASLTSGGSGPSPPVDIGELGARLTAIREGFIESGGGTNLVPRRSGRNAANLATVASNLSLGLAATFVPIAALQATSLVTFTGGRGFLAVADIDTIFLDTTLILTVLAMCYAGGVSRENVASLVFFATLAVVTTVVVAYVVTNFGTLFRLRLLTAIPAWMTPLALIAQGRRHGSGGTQ